jgi:simple sugar transport system permease protein
LPIPILADIPIVGPLFFDHNVIVYLGFVLIPLSWFYIYRTRPGLELRAIGEYPAAADVQGINVFALRYFYVILGGVMAGIGGAALTLAISPRWVEGITSGQGWIAVGLVIFAQWDPVRAAIGSYLFGAIRRLPLDLQNVGIFLRNPALGYFTNMLPYLFTIFVLIIGSRAAMRQRVGAPAALGQPYSREERGA